MDKKRKDTGNNSERYEEGALGPDLEGLAKWDANNGRRIIRDELERGRGASDRSIRKPDHE